MPAVKDEQSVVTDPVEWPGFTEPGQRRVASNAIFRDRKGWLDVMQVRTTLLQTGIDTRKLLYQSDILYHLQRQAAQI